MNNNEKHEYEQLLEKSRVLMLSDKVEEALEILRQLLARRWLRKNNLKVPGE